VGPETRDPRERKGIDECMILLGRRHQGRPEAGITPMRISHGVEIAIARGREDENDGRS